MLFEAIVQVDLCLITPTSPLLPCISVAGFQCINKLFADYESFRDKAGYVSQANKAVSLKANEIPEKVA